MPAQPHAVAQLRRDVVTYAEQLGASAYARRAVEHAVSEALTNAVVHGRPDEEPGEVIVEAWDDAAGHLLVRVSDEGGGMFPRPDHPGLGIGLNLMTQMADDVRLRDTPHESGTTVSMRFALDGAEPRLPPIQGDVAPPAAFEIYERRREGIRTVTPRGELDLSKARGVEQRLIEIGRTGESTVLDLSGLSFIDSSGITVLVRLREWAGRNDWPLELRNPSAQVRRVVELTRVGALLGIPQLDPTPES